MVRAVLAASFGIDYIYGRSPSSLRPRPAMSAEGQAAAKKAPAAPPLTSEEAEVVEVLEAEEVEEEAENVQMLEVVAVMEPEVVVDEGGRSMGRPKRRRNA